MLRKSMEIAREVQQNFLPDSRYIEEGLEIYGSCRYCQETAGDFNDFVYPSNSSEKIGVVVGDVVGHGVGASLVMASVRAILRARIDQDDEPARVIGDVNRVLCADTEESSNFVTLFYLVVDKNRQMLEWVRPGHEPALLIYPDRRQSIELYGEGVAVGIDQELSYTSSMVKITAEKQFVIIGSDGAWEAENDSSERFGKESLIDLLMAYGGEEPEYIVKRVNQEIDVFLGNSQPKDDIIFVVIKIGGEHLHGAGSLPENEVSSSSA